MGVVFRVQSIVYSVQFVECRVQGAVCSVQCAGWVMPTGAINLYTQTTSVLTGFFGAREIL